MLIRHLKRSILVLALASVVPYAYAEDAAPVYDADNMPSQFDGQPDMGPSPSSGSAVTSPAPAQQLQSEHLFTSPSPQGLTLDQRIGRLEQQANNSDKANSASRIEELQKEVQTLRGQVEEQTHQVQTLQTQVTQLQTQQHTLSADIDKRVDKLAKNNKSATVTDEPQNVDDSSTKSLKSAAKPMKTDKLDAADAAAKVDTTEQKKAGADQPNVAEEQQIYQTAYDLIKSKKYNEAIAALQKMLQKYPTGQFAANAHYWLGELYALTGKNDKSANEFSAVMSDFPDSPKVPEAQLKLGMLYLADSKWSDAKSAFKRVVRKYPGTASAHQAMEQLKGLKQLGH